MSSAQPPANGDRPADAEDRTAATEPMPASEPAPASKSSPAPKAAAAAARPAAAKRTPSPRKRTTAKTAPISPNGEAPEILDAMLGKAAADETVVGETPAPAAKPAAPRRRTTAARSTATVPDTLTAQDTSTSPAEPPIEAPPVEEAPAAAAPTAAASAEPHESEAATAVLPTADDFYRTRTGETEILTAAAEPAARETLPASPAAEPVAIGAVVEEPATPGTAAPDAATADEAAAPTDAPETEGAPPAPAAGPHAPRPGRSMNELADRLDDSRFFSSLFDFTFTSYVTRKLAGPVYVVGLVLIGLGIVVGFANSLSIAIATHSPGGAFVFLLGVLVTLVAAILSVLLLRVTIEVFCAIIEIAQNTRRRRPPRD
ncbi:DUF4282 domain-containing protein [Leifsonia shinshuensis]